MKPAVRLLLSEQENSPLYDVLRRLCDEETNGTPSLAQLDSKWPQPGIRCVFFRARVNCKAFRSEAAKAADAFVRVCH